MFSFQQHKLPKEELEENFVKFMQDSKTYGTFVLCHCDFHIRNIVYDENTGKYKMIDYYLQIFVLTHWGRVTYICVGDLTIIGSDNGLSPVRRQATIWTNVGMLLIWSLGTNLNENLFRIWKFS